MCFFGSVSPGLAGTMIPSAVTVVDLKSHFPSIESAAAVIPRMVLKALWNTGRAASLPFLFGSSSKITVNLI